MSGDVKITFGPLAEMVRMLAEAQEAAGEDSSEARAALRETADVPRDVTVVLEGPPETEKP